MKKGSNPSPPEGIKKPPPPPPPIKATVKKADIYHFNINGVDFPDFTVESEWEGMKKLKNPAGKIIIADFNEAGSMIPFFVKNIFFEDDGVEITVVKASPDILAALYTK